MNRVAARAFVLLCASPLACASGGGTPPPPPPLAPYLPAGCVQGTSGTQSLTVDDSATVGAKECLAFRRGESKLVWTGSANARYLLIAFKDKAENGFPKNPPADPSCSGRTCVLEKSQTQFIAPNDPNEMGYRYSVVVILQSGKVVSVDPRLIIQR